MDVKELMQKVLELDPHDIVKCGLDSFDPYAYIQLPKELQSEVDKLSDSADLFSEFLDDYLGALQDGSVDRVKELYHLQ